VRIVSLICLAWLLTACSDEWTNKDLGYIDQLNEGLPVQSPSVMLIMMQDCVLRIHLPLTLRRKKTIDAHLDSTICKEGKILR
jgi:hypothetical protein